MRWASMAAGAFAAALTFAAAQAQELRIVVPFGPGGTPDVIGRLVGAEIAKRSGETAVFENKPGAGGVIGSNYVLGMKDASVVMIADVSVYALTPILRAQNLRFDMTTDFKPVSGIARTPMFLIAGPKIPVKSVAEYIEYARRTPGLNYGTPGAGTPHHILMEYFNGLTGVKTTHVPYDTSARQLNALLTGEISVMFSGAPGVDMLTSNNHDVKVLAAIGAHRSSLRPDVPTLAEQGVAGFDGSAMDIRFGMVAPAASPDARIARYSDYVREGLAERTLVERFAALGLEMQPASAKEFAALMKSDTEFFRMAIARTGVRLQ
jgi:tripartite-type tricarboxylate transporter receptor subunit TctC